MKKLLFIGLLAIFATGVIFSSQTCIAEEDGRSLPEASQEGFWNGMPVASTGDTINEDHYVKGKLFVRVKSPSSNPELFDKVPAEDLFSATPELTEIAYTYNIKTEATKRLFTALLNSPKADIRQAATSLKNTFLIEADTDDLAKLIKDLEKSEGIVFAEGVPLINTSYVPNDYDATQQWYLDKIEAEDAWEIYQANPDTSEVLIAIVDDAVKLDHEDLNFNLWVNPDEIPNNGIDDYPENGYIDDVNGYDVADGDGDPNPPSNVTNTHFMHGTHVSGIAAAVSDNYIGIASISGSGSNKVKIMAVKTKLDSSTGPTLEATFQGLEYAIAAGADIINMSWGGYGYSHTYQDLFIAAHSLGITLVAAAGNDGWQTYMFPASYLYVISVGATDQTDHKASFSNYGYQIDVMAPGVDILSTLPVNDNSYGNLSGTSMASPLVAGLCGLMLSYNDTLTPHQIELILKQSCDDIDAQNSNYVGEIGSGRINADSAMQALQASNIPAPENFTAINTSLTPSAWGEAVWGDYDNDGKLDVLIAEGDYSLVPRIYHNDGLVNGQWQFTNINAQLGSSLNMCSVAWFDYDNDGLLDFAMAGYASSNNVLKIFHNDGIVNNQWQFSLLNNQPIILPRPNYVTGPRLACGDYDNDGRQDIAIIGSKTMRIYHNDGLVNCQWNFSLAPVVGLPPENLIGYSYGYVAWGDYNNDGRLDLAVTGSGNSSSLGPITRIYRNDGLVSGQWQFTDIDAGLMNLALSCIAWGDYNNDGLLDILVGGNDFLPPTPPGTWHTKVYRNDGLVNGQWQFTDIGANLPTVNCWGPHNLDWGDFNNDGQLDIVLAGEYNDGDPYDGHSITAVYINDNGVFSEDNSELLGIVAASWGDYDGDGKLDILSAGFVDTGLNYVVYPRRTQIYHNNVLTANTPPNPPSASSLQATVTGQDVALSWQKGSDSQTPQNGLYYNLFAGTGPNLSNTLSPMSEIPGGLRRVADIGGQSQNTSWSLKDLPNGTYYWGVQSVDTALAGSSFASGATFIVGGGVTYTIQGQIHLANGTGIDGITVTATGRPPTTTAGGGYYSVVVPLGWSGYVTPVSYAYSFAPEKSCYSNVNQNYPDDDYIATPLNHSISGRVTLNGSPATGVAGVLITASNGGGSQTTSPQGYYTIYNVQGGWMGDLTPSETGYTFAPTSIPVTLPLSGNLTNKNFVATPNTPATFTISGDITDLQPNNTYSVDVIGIGANGSGNLLPVSGTSGSYTFTDVPYGWEGELTATSVAYNFIPLSRTIPSVTANVTDQDFAATLKTFTISGTVKDNFGLVIQGATLTATGSPGTVNVPINNGSYSYDADYGWTVTLTPSAAGYDFEPASETFTNITSNQTQDFVGTLQTFTISGTVSGLSVPDNSITITAQGTGNYGDFPATFNPNGTYSTGQVVPYGWEGDLVVTSAAYNITADEPVFNGGPVTDHVTQNYTAAIKRFTISGNISGILSPSNPYPITIDATNTNNPTYGGVYGPYSIMAATDGSYSIPDVPYGWEGKLSADSVAYNFDPTEIPVTSVTDDLPDQDFTATLKEYAISGDISDLIPGNTYAVTITAECDDPLDPWYVSVDNIDATDGHYDFTLPYGWQGGLLAKSIAYELREDPEGAFTSPVTEPQEQNYTATLKKIEVSGLILGLDANTNNPPPITITAECSDLLPSPWYETVIADASDGSYSMLLPYGWDGKLIAESPVYTLTEYPYVTFVPPVFSPQFQDYKATPIMLTISGTVYLDGVANKPIEGVTLTAKGWNGYMVNELTNSDGDYTIDVPYGFSGKVAPSKTGYTFAPPDRLYNNVIANIDGDDYIGTNNIISHLEE